MLLLKLLKRSDLIDDKKKKKPELNQALSVITSYHRPPTHLRNPNLRSAFAKERSNAKFDPFYDPISQYVSPFLPFPLPFLSTFPLPLDLLKIVILTSFLFYIIFSPSTKCPIMESYILRAIRSNFRNVRVTFIRQHQSY